MFEININTGLPQDALLLAQLKTLYTASCVEPVQRTYYGDVYWDLSKETEGKVVHGFVGYFTCHLFGGIELDTRHGSASRNTFHWESMFFPLTEPYEITTSISSFGLRLSRCSGLTKISISSESQDSRGTIFTNFWHLILSPLLELTRMDYKSYQTNQRSS